MKALKKLLILLVLAITSSLFVNCSSDGDGGSSSNTFYLKYKINGTLVEVSDPEVINSLSKSLTGFTTNGKSLTLYFPLDVATGTFTITDEPSNVDAYGASYSDFETEVASDNETGSVTVTQVNADVIKGTFSFTGTNEGATYTVTEGEFRAENIE